MPDLTARSAIVNALAEERDAHPWIIQTPPMVASIVLAALGITPDTTVSEISAGLWLLAHAGVVDMSQRQGGTWVARDRDRYSIRGVGASPAAAIHALNTKLAERADG